ncbi:MAG: hypothetical protein CM1200mP14_21860 [Gammaproteobacteria bacterium]|nr:MAG: hypothetical protein CM1200mP14_21860 [Gammaproteobacteria bacterium]
MTMSRYSFFFLILVASTPAVLAQDTEQVGDWTVRQTQGADRSRAVSMTLVPDNMEVQGIHMFAFRCSANLLALVVTHSYMAGDDNRVQIRYQLGDAAEQRVSGRLESGNQVSVYLGISESELQTLRSNPRIALVIRDSYETYRMNWTDLEGTSDAVDRLPCIM